MKQQLKTAGKIIGDSALLLALAITPAALAQDDITDNEDRQAQREQFQAQLRENLEERRALLDERREARREALQNNPELRRELREKRQQRLTEERNPRRALGVERGVRQLREAARRQWLLRQAAPPARELQRQRLRFRG